MIMPSRYMVSYCVIISLNLPHYRVELVFAYQIFKLTQQGEHCWVTWAFTIDDVTDGIVVAENLNDLTCPALAPELGTHNDNKKFLDMDRNLWVT